MYSIKQPINKPNIFSLFTGRGSNFDDLIKTDKFKDFHIVTMEQLHRSRFCEVAVEQSIVMPSVDAAITQKENILLCVKTADCLPILIHWQDPKNKKKQIVAAVHAGRKGTDKKILLKILRHFKKEYRAKSNITVWFGPAICEKCYQTDENTDLHYNLVKKNEDQVHSVFKDDNVKIIKSNKCTFHQNKNFYSYRKTGRGVPMNYSFIGIKPAK